MKRLWMVLGIVLGLGAIGGAIWYFVSKPAETQPQFVTTPVTKGDVISRVTATGTLSALVTVQVGTQISGRILSLNADFNGTVKKGQVLAKLDPELFTAALAQSTANERAATANVTKAKAQAADSARKLKRATELAAQKLIAPADLDTAQAEVDVALASIEAAEAALAQARAQRQTAQLNVTNTTITSPIDGTIISRAIDVGQTVAASLSSPTLFTIAENLSRMQVDTSVAEADVGKLKEGLEATFTVDAFPNQRFTGKVRQIRYAATVVSNVVTYDAVIDVENKDLLLRPGMTANVNFITQEVEGVLRVPNAALRFRWDKEGQRDAGVAPAGTRMVTVLREGKPRRVPIVAGLSDGTFTQVVSGLDEGDQVVTDRTSSPSSGAAPGAQQRPGGGPSGMGRLF